MNGDRDMYGSSMGAVDDLLPNLHTEPANPTNAQADQGRSLSKETSRIQAHAPRSVNRGSAGLMSPSITSRSATTPSHDASDVMDTNAHTRNLEYYGGSSSVAFLRHVETVSKEQDTGLASGPPERSFASLLHNSDFHPNSTSSPAVSKDKEIDNNRYYFRVARTFLDAYFSNIHHIQPLFDEDAFLSCCEDLWFDRAERQSLSFVALYYTTLSLGSLLMVNDGRLLYGSDRFTWSRKLFDKACEIVSQLSSATDLEMVQCYYMMVSLDTHI